MDHLLSFTLTEKLGGKQNNLGFNPVQQGTGIDQSHNAVKIGWSGSRLKATVDNTNLGNFVFDGQLESYVNTNCPRKTNYTNEAKAQTITLEYSKTYLVVLTNNISGARDTNDLYIVSTPDRAGTAGGVQKVAGNINLNLTISNNVLTITPPDSTRWYSVNVLRLS